MEALARNRKAFHNYEVIDKYECGVELYGSEVKSLRAGKVQIADAYAAVEKGQLWIYNLHIHLYERAGMFKPEMTRKRRLLAHSREIAHLATETSRKQLTLIPLSLYFKKQWVKVELGLCRGKKEYDKRHSLADKESKRHLASLTKTRR